MEKKQYSKWELAYYLIEAKKCVDSVLYVADNISKLSNLDMKEQIESKRCKFYINCAVLLDKSINKSTKEQLKENDSIVESIYYERDKNQAHKDYNYKIPQYSSLYEIAELMKKQLAHVRNLCSDSLPQVVTLDFVHHDKVLFRFVNGITPAREEEILKLKHPLYKREIIDTVQPIERNVFYDVESYKMMNDEEKSSLAVVIENGVNEAEGLQNRQDACIRINVMSGKNMWCTNTN